MEREKLFKTVLGEMMSTEGLSDEEVVKIVMGAVASFCEMFGIIISWYIVKRKN